MFPMNNPIMMLVQAMNSGRNPMQMIQQMAGQNPQINQAYQLMQGKSPQQLQMMAQNMAKERGISIENLASNLGLRLR